MTAALVYVIKYVGNMETAIRFHRDQLGLALRFESNYWSEFETGTTTLALHLASSDHLAGSCELGFRVRDFDAFYAAKAGKGIEFVSPPSNLRGQKLAKFRDSDGAQCRLSGQPA